MGARQGFRLAVIAAVAMLAIATLMSVTAPPCNPLPMSALTAFELVRTASDLHRLFGEAGAACRSDLVSQLDHANLIDTFAYIPAYTAFYGLTAWALGRRDRTLGWIAVGLTAGCAVADVLENVGMFQLSAAPDRTSQWLAALMLATSFKWVGLAVVTAVCGLMLARRGGLGWAGLIACSAPLAPSLWSLAAPDDAGQWLIPGMTIASVMLLAICVVGSFRNSHGAQAPPVA